jgi:hypothetical protein
MSSRVFDACISSNRNLRRSKLRCVLLRKSRSFAALRMTIPEDPFFKRSPVNLQRAWEMTDRAAASNAICRSRRCRSSVR